MLYMVIEKYKDKEAVYKRFREKVRMMPEGVRLLIARFHKMGIPIIKLMKHKMKNCCMNVLPTGMMLPILNLFLLLVVKWSYVNILDTKSQTFLCCTSS